MKLYLFGIGGTGSRVVRSLVMLAASGVEMGADIVPIIVDPDFANADLTRTIEAIRTYSRIKKSLNFNNLRSNKFFGTQFIDILNGFSFPIADTRGKSFSDFIGHNTMSKENKALVELLFSEHNLKADMDVGFKGNPNMGSIVLNQFSQSAEFLKFASDFSKGDRIFIISSIFGGTGASGFPLLVNTLRTLEINTPNKEDIINAPIGAITVLPYFNVEPNNESEINSSTFIGKTKAALEYYSTNLCADGKSSVNLWYYIGDTIHKKYENNEGGNSQKNDAHFLELASALSIIDYTKIDDSIISPCIRDSNGKVITRNPIFKEFGVVNDIKQLTFSDLAPKTNSIIRLPLTQFVLFSKYFKDQLSSSLCLPWAKDNDIDNPYLQTQIMMDLKNFQQGFIDWLTEMQNNEVSFKPFILDVNHRNLFDLVEGVRPKKKFLSIKKGYDLFDAYLGKEKANIKDGLSKEEKIMELFFEVTKSLCKDKFLIQSL